MTENTEKKVKSWSRDSIHKTYEAAFNRRAELTAKFVHGSDPDADFEAKIRLQRGLYVVKVWKGKMEDTPTKAKPKRQGYNSDPAISSGLGEAEQKKAEGDFLGWDLAGEKKEETTS